MTKRHLFYASVLASSLLCETSFSASPATQSQNSSVASMPNANGSIAPNTQGNFTPPKIEEWDSLVAQLSDGMRNNLVSVIGKCLKESTSPYVEGSKRLQSDAIQRQQGILADPKTDQKTKIEVQQDNAFSKLQWLALSGLVPDSMKTQLNQEQQRQQESQQAAAIVNENSDWATLVKASGYSDKDIPSLISQISNLPTDQKEKSKADLKKMIDANNSQIKARPNSAKVPFYQHSNAIYYLKLAILNGKAPQNPLPITNTTGSVASQSLPIQPQSNPQGGNANTTATAPNFNQNPPMQQNGGVIPPQNPGAPLYNTQVNNTPVNNTGAATASQSLPIQSQSNPQGGNANAPATAPNFNQNPPMQQNGGVIPPQNSGTPVNSIGQSSSSTPLPQPSFQGGNSSTPITMPNSTQNPPMQQNGGVIPPQNPGTPLNSSGLGSSSSPSSSSGFVPPKLEEWDSLVAQLSDGMRNNLVNLIQKDLKISANSNAKDYQKLQSDTVLRQEAFLNSGEVNIDRVAVNQSIALAKLEWLALGGQYPQSFKTLLDQNAANQQARQNAAATITAASDWQTLLTATGTTPEAAQNMIADFSKLTDVQKNIARTESNKKIASYQQQINANPESAKNPIWKSYIAREYLDLAILDGKYQNAQSGTSSNQMTQQGNNGVTPPQLQPQTSNNSNGMNMNNGTNPTNISQNSMGGVNNSGTGANNSSGNTTSSNTPQSFQPSSNTMPQQSSRGGGKTR